jgi:hypothetical protein
MSSILDMLGGGQGPPPDLGSVQGGAGIPGQPDNDAAKQALAAMIQAAQDFLDAEQDDQDKSIVSACLAKLQSIKGTQQKQNEAAAGITPVHKAMSRAYGG